MKPALLTRVPALAILLTAGAWFAHSPAHAQISKPTEDELNAVPPQFNDLVHGRSKLLNSAAADAANRKRPMPRPSAPQPIPNPHTDPRDFTGEWASAGMGGPPGAGDGGGPPLAAPAALHPAPHLAAHPGRCPTPNSPRGPGGALTGGFPPTQADDPRPGTIVSTTIDANRVCEPAMSVSVAGARIYQTPRQITFVSTDELRVRRYYPDDKPDGPTTPSYAGRKTTTWDGNTLVIHTTNLKGIITPLGFNVEIGVHKLKIANPTLTVETRIHKSADNSDLIFDQTWSDSAVSAPPYHRTATLHYVATQPALDNECSVEGAVFGPNYGKPVQ